MIQDDPTFTYNGAQDTIIVPLGTIAIFVAQNFRTREISNGLMADQWVKVVGFDAQGVDHKNPFPTVEKGLQMVELMPHEIIRADIGDPETRDKAEKRGKLWMTSPEFPKNPGAAAGKKGVGGVINRGRGLYALNENAFASQFANCLRKLQDYHQPRIAGKDSVNARMQPVIRAIVPAGFVGGTANGAFAAALQTIAQKAAELKANIRIVPIAILMGTLNPGDRSVAALNQLTALRSWQARFEGKFKDLTCTNGDYQIICDPLILVSNANNFGEMASLDHVIDLLGLYLYLICHTPLGPRVHQEALNIQETEHKDDLGDLRSAATIGLAVASLNKDKIAAYAEHKKPHIFLTNLLQEQDAAEPVKHAAAITVSLGLRGTPTDDMAMQRLLCLRGKNNANVQERARSTVRQRMGNRIGFRGCVDTYHAGRYTLETLIPGSLIPEMSSEGAFWMTECSGVLTSEVSGYLQRQTGLSEGRQFLEHLRQHLENCQKYNRDKLAQAQSYNQDLRKGKVGVEKTFYRLQKRNRLLRALSIFTKAKFRRQYPKYVDALIQDELEIAARKILDKRVFPRIREAISAEFGRISGVRNAIICLRERIGQEVDRLKYLSDEFYSPVGDELADIQLMDKTLEDIFNSEGGKSKALGSMFDAFCRKYHSLEAFTQYRTEEIEQFLVQHCRTAAQGIVQQLHVLDVLKAAFPSEQQQNEIVAKKIGQSDGKVKISGEGDENIARLKYVCGPDPRTVEWGLKLANNINALGGDWRGCIIEKMSTIFAVQYRGRVSLNQQIADTAKLCQLPDDPKERAKIGEDPVIQLAPSAHPSNRELDLTVAQGLVSKQICQNKGGYELKGLHEPIALGNSLDEVRSGLAPDYQGRMRIYREFCMQLARSPESLLKDIEQAVASHQLDSCPLVRELGGEPFAQAKEVAEALLTYLRRIKLDNSQKA